MADERSALVAPKEMAAKDSSDESTEMKLVLLQNSRGGTMPIRASLPLEVPQPDSNLCDHASHT
eukprot:1160271-Pelagomonas_calceolata.AAC.8